MGRNQFRTQIIRWLYREIVQIECTFSRYSSQQRHPFHGRRPRAQSLAGNPKRPGKDKPEDWRFQDLFPAKRRSENHLQSLCFKRWYTLGWYRWRIILFQSGNESFYTYTSRNAWRIDENGKKQRLNSFSVKCVAEDKNGDLLVGTWSSGLMRLKRGSNVFRSYPKLNDMNSAYSLFSTETIASG